MIAANKWAIVSEDYEKAKIAAVSAVCGHENSIIHNWSSKGCVYITFKNGVEIEWYRPSKLKGTERFSRLWCDKNIDAFTLKRIVLGSCYLGRKGDIVWI